jgi:hypothetical protein
MSKYSIIILSLLTLIFSAQGINDAMNLSAPLTNEKVIVDEYYAPTGPTDQTWTALAAPTTTPDRLNHGTVYDPVNDKVYMLGGNPTGSTGAYVALCQQYDPTANTWTDKASMPTARGWVCGAYVRGKIYVIGGLSNAAVTAVNEEYNIATNAWTTKAPRPSALACDLEAVWRDSLVYVMGGWDGSSASGSVNVDIYNPFTNSWAVGTPLPQNADMGSAVIVGDTIYITNAINRSGSACWTNLYMGVINPANPTQITWVMGPVHIAPTFDAGSAVLGNDVYWLGGFLNATTVTNQWWKYNITTGVITTMTPPYPQTVARCCYMTSRPSAYELYVIAGDAGGNWSAPNNYYYKIALPPPVPNDVGVEAILSPGGYHLPNTLMTPSATVMNHGTAAQTNFPVICSILGAGGVLRHTNTQTVASLAAGAATTVTFTGWTPTIEENLSVMMKTALTGDQYPNNDRKTSTCIIANVYSQDFEASDGNYVADPLTGAWEWGTPTAGPTGAHSGTKLWGTFLSGLYIASANWKLTSEVYTATANNPTLKFWQWYNMEQTWDGGNVKISTNGVDWTIITPTGGYPGTASTANAGIPGEPCFTGIAETWAEVEFPLTLTSGQTFYLRWHFGSDGSVQRNGWYIDDVLGIGFQAQPPPTNDVGVHAIRAPGANHMVNTPMSPIAVVKNYGSATQTNFPVVCSIIGAGSAVRYTNTKTVASLAAGDTVLVNFDAWTPTIGEDVTVAMRTNLSGDLNPSNDRMSRTTSIGMILLMEGFEDAAFPPAGWVVYNNDGGTYQWVRNTSYPHTGTAHASCRYETSTLQNDDWLVTPQLAIPSGGATFKFWYRTSTASTPYDEMVVRLSTTGNAIPNFTTVLDSFTVNSTTYAEKVISLNTYGGQSIYLAFVDRGFYAWTLCVDDVEVQGQVGIAEPNPNPLPILTSLNSAKPNPVTNGIAHISFNIAAPTHASLKIYDASGRIIRTLVNANYEQGTYNLTWNGRDDNDRAVAEGVYFYTLETDNNNITKKLVLTR